MRAAIVGVVVGGVLGLLDGLSAWFSPEARGMMIPIVVGSTIKGVLTGLVTGGVARWRRSLPLGVTVGAVVGFLLSTLAARAQPDHYWVIVLPGMLVGVITGIATQRTGAAVMLLLCLAGTVPGVHGQAAAAAPSLAALSVDRARKAVIFRQFHVEGFVNQDVLERPAAPGTLVFLTEAIENIAPGWRGRETYRLLGADEFEEVFELAAPGKPFEVYSKARLHRVKHNPPRR